MSATLKDLEKAIQIAVNAHFGQIDKAGAPYILHPLRVMMSCETVDEKTVAVLHDVIEDTDITADDLLAKGLPHHVVNAVKVLTRCGNETYEDFIKRVKQNPLAATVKLADLSDNLDVKRLSTLDIEDTRRLVKYLDAVTVLKN